MIMQLILWLSFNALLVGLRATICALRVPLWETVVSKSNHTSYLSNAYSVMTEVGARRLPEQGEYVGYCTDLRRTV